MDRNRRSGWQGARPNRCGPYQRSFAMAVLTMSRRATSSSVSASNRCPGGSISRRPGLAVPDENNYYIVRANALEGNVVLYKVKRRRTDLPVTGEGVPTEKKRPCPPASGVNWRCRRKGLRFRCG